jgi:hypothetical protein
MKIQSQDFQVTKIHGLESQVTKNTSNLLNLHGVTKFLKISRTDEVTKVARTHLGPAADIGILARSVLRPGYCVVGREAR